MEQSEIDAMLKNMDSGDGSDSKDNSEAEPQFDAFPAEPEQTRPANKPSVAVTAASFEEIQKAELPKQVLDMDFVLDIPLSLNVELGRNRMLISELLQLGQGSVVELTKLAGEPMDVYVNQRLIARGEVVVVNEKFGVRLTDIVSPVERVNKLK
jgi:flagellar motor switch protein FliN/FliY